MSFKGQGKRQRKMLNVFYWNNKESTGLCPWDWMVGQVYKISFKTDT